MSTDLKRRNIPFSPPDMTEAEVKEVSDAILSGWITTGPRTYIEHQDDRGGCRLCDRELCGYCK